MQARRIAHLNKLASDEKKMLRPFIKNSVRARRVPQSSATFRALQGAGILAAGSQVTDYDYNMNDYALQVFIQPWAFEHLSAHPELLE